jgi:hypothetical protein
MPLALATSFPGHFPFFEKREKPCGRDCGNEPQYLHAETKTCWSLWKIDKDKEIKSWLIWQFIVDKIHYHYTKDTWLYTYMNYMMAEFQLGGDWIVEYFDILLWNLQNCILWNFILPQNESFGVTQKNSHKTQQNYFITYKSYCRSIFLVIK